MRDKSLDSTRTHLRGEGKKTLVVVVPFSLYPEDVEKLKALAKLNNAPRSRIIRELIQVAFVERVLQKRETPDGYIEECQKF